MRKLLCRFVDIFYTLQWDAETSMPYYRGFRNSIIRLEIATPLHAYNFTFAEF